jgi:translation initiation factor IF-3
VPDFKPRQNYFQRRNKPKGPKSNHKIFSPEVQVISSDGKNLGILRTKEAIHLAEQEGLDLIEISPNAKPPVCKIIDIGKYKYDLQKKANKAKKKQKIVNLKEIKLRPVTDIHDYNFKIKNAQKFLSKGDKVKFTVRFKGREMQHTHLGHELMKRIINDTNALGKVEIQPKFEGRQIVMIVQPI